MASYNEPPIPPPDGSSTHPSPILIVSSLPSPKPGAGRDWKQAPKVVKYVAYPIPVFLMFASPFLYVMGAHNPGVEMVNMVESLLFFGLAFWLSWGLKRGARYAWALQLVISILALFAFPIGTIIYGYILSQWFNHDVRAWFRIGQYYV